MRSWPTKNGTRTATSSKALMPSYTRTGAKNRPAGVTRRRAMAASRFSHNQAGAPASWKLSVTAKKARMPPAAPNSRQVAIVMTSTRKKSSNCHWPIQLPGARSAPGAANSWWPGGRLRSAETLAKRVSQPVTGMLLRVSTRAMDSRSTAPRRSSTPFCPSFSPLVISRFSPSTAALSKA